MPRQQDHSYLNPQWREIATQWVGLAAYVTRRRWRELRWHNADLDEAFSRALKGLMRGAQLYNPDRGTVASYLFKCCWHEIQALLDKQRTKRQAFQRDMRKFSEIRDMPDVRAPDDQDSNIEQQTSEALGCLDEREKSIISRYFGIGCPSQTSLEIASALGVTKQRVQQLIAKAIQKMRRHFARQGEFHEDPSQAVRLPARTKHPPRRGPRPVPQGPPVRELDHRVAM